MCGLPQTKLRRTLQSTSTPQKISEVRTVIQGFAGVRNGDGREGSAEEEAVRTVGAVEAAGKDRGEPTRTSRACAFS